MHFRMIGLNRSSSENNLFNNCDPQNAYYVKVYENGDAYTFKVATGEQYPLESNYTAWTDRCLNNKSWVLMWTGIDTSYDRKKQMPKPPSETVPTTNYVYRIQKIEVNENGRMFDPPVKSITIHPKSLVDVDLLTPLYKLIHDKE